MFIVIQLTDEISFSEMISALFETEASAIGLKCSGEKNDNIEGRNKIPSN
jgi:hypothetical protein